MKVLIVLPSIIPAYKYGGTERIIWYLGKELVKLGHQVTFLVNKGSSCDFAPVFFLDSSKRMEDQIPPDIDLVHFHYVNPERISKPYLITRHVNDNHVGDQDMNTVFISKNQAERFGSNVFVHNGLDWTDYGKVNFKDTRGYFHFLGNAAWRVKNVTGAIDIVRSTQNEKLRVLGGTRLNIKMGFRLTISQRIKFYGMVGGEEKNQLLRSSKGLIFPVCWHEPFGLAIIESLYFGCPVFGTPYGSLPELVNAEVGFLSNSKQELVHAIQDCDSYSKEKCNAYAVEEFNSKKMTQGYLEKYEQVLNGQNLNSQAPKAKLHHKGLLPFTA